ncbi:hypothetical protein ASPZODRAFT_131814 [Penicilliopsis zonata CBS 506.65]|uniref:Uncharacterized protein n=1 Tax=Penicilliopsis zonata CBS 506.65 TaxID=1073090 RepID=A0A1L9SIG4_9EURO|nr:hypothetical protein ASPZODRAFT_131814 [Penicilliopsis zonata CBS 506.65]OJJ46906.1 hypothetical protein ASPZODRAFT_131814 [Penicilliopsis zonata CBS 506.65]
MPPVLPPPLMALPPNFNPFAGTTTPSIGSRTYSGSSDSDSWSRHRSVGKSDPASGFLTSSCLASSAMSQQSSIYSSSSGGHPVIYQPSTKRAFPPPRDFGAREIHQIPARAPGKSTDIGYPGIPVTADSFARFPDSCAHMSFPRVGPPPHPASAYREWEHPAHMSSEYLQHDLDMNSMDSPEYLVERTNKRGADKAKGTVKYHSSRRPSNRDEFDGPHQLLEMPTPRTIASQERELPHLPTNLDVSEQDQILTAVNDRLSQCAFDFVAKYQFPIPLEADKRQVRVPSDREWTEWVYLLKRLATKRRIPARVLYNGQIKQLVTVLENSLEMRHAAKHQSRPVKDDRNVLQLISAGTQVAKILKDAGAMEVLDRLYVDTEKRIQDRRSRRVKFATP